MFRQFATRVSPDDLFTAHPFELAWLLEEVWRQVTDRTPPANSSLGDPNQRSNLNATPAFTTYNWPPLSNALAPILDTCGCGRRTGRCSRRTWRA